MKIRHYGILGNRKRKKMVELARSLIERIRPKERKTSEKSENQGEERSEAVPCCPWCGSANLAVYEVRRSGICALRQASYASPIGIVSAGAGSG